MKTINQQMLDREIILSECDGWKVKGIFKRELFEGIIAVEAYKCFILSNNSISGFAPKNKRGYKRARYLCGKDNFCIEDNLKNMTIYSFEQPKEDVDIQIQKLKEVIDPDPYKIFEADAKEYGRVKDELKPIPAFFTEDFIEWYNQTMDLAEKFIENYKKLKINQQ